MRKFDFKTIISYFNPRRIDNLPVNPYRDWKVILISFFLLLVVILGADAVILWKSLKATEEKVVIKEHLPPMIDKNSLKNAVSEIKNKEEQFRKGASVSEIKDPSL